MPSTQLFLDGLGPGFVVAFLSLTGAALYQMACVHEHATGAMRAARRLLHTSGGSPLPLLAALAELEAAASKARLAMSSMPALGLLGTSIGMFYALAAMGELQLGETGPVEILGALMDAGVSSALATTVVGQALYFLLGQLWGAVLARPCAGASALGSEALARAREPQPEAPAGPVLAVLEAS